jgi:hypothetical protein
MILSRCQYSFSVYLLHQYTSTNTDPVCSSVCAVFAVSAPMGRHLQCSGGKACWREGKANNRWAVGKPLDLTQVAGRATSAEPPGQRAVSQARSSSKTRGGGSALEGLAKPSWWGSYDSSFDVEDDVGRSKSMTPMQRRRSQAACSAVNVSQNTHPPDQQRAGAMTPRDSQFCPWDIDSIRSKGRATGQCVFAGV